MIVVVEDFGLAERLLTLSKQTGLREGWRSAGQRVKAHAQGTSKVLTGRLRASIGYRSKENDARIIAGRGMADAPYAPVIHWGEYNNIQGDYWMMKARVAMEPTVVSILEDELDSVMRKNNV